MAALAQYVAVASPSIGQVTRFAAGVDAILSRGDLVLADHDEHYLQVVWCLASALGIAVLVTLVIVYRRALCRLELEDADPVITEHDLDVP